MYCPTAATAPAYPRAAAFANATQYAGGGRALLRRRNIAGRSLRAMLESAGHGPAAIYICLQGAHARALAGLPIGWPA
jgi:hypothetical protein